MAVAGAPDVALLLILLPIRRRSLIVCPQLAVRGVVDEADVAPAAATRQRLPLLRPKSR